MSPSQSQLLQTEQSLLPHGRLSDLVTKALSEVAARFSNHNAHLASNAPLVHRILHSAMARSGETLRTAADHMIAQGVPCEVIIDDIVPRAARLMGEEWVSDVSSFASVTLGSSRLQSLVRDLSEDWTADGFAVEESAVLLCVPKGAQHTLGATVVSSQLRRMGHSVQFAPGSGTTELAQALNLDSYNAVVVSASLSEQPSDVCEIVDIVKTQCDTIPVIVGGTLLKRHGDLAQTTGADAATSDLDQASHFFSVAK